LAALYIIYEAISKWLTGLHLENINQGTYLITVATVLNGALGWYLVKQGKKYHSIVLEANGKHVLTDSLTSFGVIIALLLTLLTGWLPFDPILAIIVAANILWTGGKLVRRSIGGLMDETDPIMDAQLRTILDGETRKYNIHYHNLKHRNTGNKMLVEFHLLFQDHETVAHAHEISTKIEREIYSALPMQTEIISHLEPEENHDEIHKNLLQRVNMKT
jgi:cation diffusion facilitator family transporter